ncbi:MAG: YceD family protein [Acidimicrobiales bacterium]
MSRRPFLVNVAPILRQSAGRQTESRRGPIPDLRVCGSTVPVGCDVEVEAVLEPAHPGVLVSGVVSADWSGECRRCLAPAAGRLRVEVRELFEPGGDPETTYPLIGEQVDLESMARDAILCELPLAPLCRPGCRGLCPECGADRNVDECQCPGA